VGGEIRADPAALATLAQAVLGASKLLGDGYRDATGSLGVPASAFGNTANGAGMHGSYGTVVEEAALPFDGLVAVLEGDVDRIYRVAFNYQQADLEAARRLREEKRRQRMME
jgi:hypothetical protein